MELRLSGYLTKEQYLLGIKIFRRIFATNKIMLILNLWLLEIGVGGFLLIIGFGIWFDHTSIAAIFLIIIGSILIFLGIGQKQAPEKIWENIKDLQITGSVTDRGIVIKSGTGQNNYQWSDLMGYGEEEDIVLLVPNNSNVGHILAKNFFKDGQSWLDFKRLLAVKLPQTDVHQRENMPMDRSQILLWVIFGLAVLAILFQAVR